MTLAPEQWAKCVGAGPDAWDVREHLKDLCPEADLDEVQPRRRARLDQLIAAAEPRDGILEWIDRCEANSIPFAIGSSSVFAWVDQHLKKIGLSDRFEVVVTRDNLPAKPAPDIYLECCQRLDVAPGKAVAFEDSPNGVRAAKAAGCRAVACPNEVTGWMDLSEADLVVKSLADISLEDLRRLP